MHLKLNFKEVSPLQAKALAAYFGTIAAGSEVATTSAETPINIKKLSAELKTEEKAPQESKIEESTPIDEENAPQESKTVVKEPEENATEEKQELSAAEIKRERKRQTDRNGRRKKKLIEIGLIWTHGEKSFDYGEIHFDLSDISDMSDDEFKKVLADTKLRKEYIDESVEDDFDDENVEDDFDDKDDKDDEILDPEELKRDIKEQIAAKSKDRAIKKQMKAKITELGADTWKALPDNKLPELLAHFKSL